MKIPPVSVISSKSNYNKVNFAGREDNERVTNPTPSKGPFVAIPLATLIALMTANYSPANAKDLENEPTQTELVTPNNIENINIVPQTRSADVDPHNIVSLDDRKILETTKFVSGGKKYNLIYTTIDSKLHTNDVQYVYIAPSDFDGHVKSGNSKVIAKPPKVINLVYHDLGDDSKSFCGVSVVSNVVAPDFKSTTTRYEEIRVPDEIAQKIVDLKANETQWVNKTSIGFIETNNPTLFPPKEL